MAQQIQAADLEVADLKELEQLHQATVVQVL
jgi:hypothetical protein